MKLNRKQATAIGVLFFGLLFGAGNVIFPVFMGQEAGANYLSASLGFLITGIGLPVLAIISYSLSKKESLLSYAAPAGKVFSYFFAIALLLTIGPLFAIPRTATVAFEVGIHAFVGDNTQLPLLIYSAIFFGLAFFFAMKPSKLLDVIARFLAPLFIILMSILIVAALLTPMADPAGIPVAKAYASAAMVQGAIDGYQTMDVLAALAFGSIIMTNIRAFGIDDDRRLVAETAKSSVATIVIMSILYIALAYLGASGRGVLPAQENGGLLLALISTHYFGIWGQLLLAAIVTVACLKTAIGLIVSLSHAFESILPGKLSYRTWATLFAGVSFLIANFQLNTIITLSVPVLMLLYPLAITLIALWFFHSFLPLSKRGFQLPLLFVALPALVDFLKATPEAVKSSPAIVQIIEGANQVLPFAKIGMGWAIPLLCALILVCFVGRERPALPR